MSSSHSRISKRYYYRELYSVCLNCKLGTIPLTRSAFDITNCEHICLSYLDIQCALDIVSSGHSDVVDTSAGINIKCTLDIL